jgi:type IV pilus assembly protein PilM
LFRRQKSLIGLDVGSSVVKAVELTLDGPEPVVTGFARTEIPPGGTASEAVAACFEGGHFRSKRVVTSMAGQSVVVRYVPMPKMSESDLRQAIRFETDKYLPFDLDEVQLDLHPLKRAPASGSEPDKKDKDKATGQQNVLIAACKTLDVEERVNVLQTHGLVPIAVDIDAFAVANAWDLCGVPTGEGEAAPGGSQKAIALVDVGSVRTSINVLVAGETCFSREIAIAGNDMTQAVARSLSLETFEAEAIKRAGESHESEIQAAIMPVLEDLVSELTLSLEYVEHHESVEIDEILLSGGGAMAPGAVQYIEQATGRKARTWNPLEGLRVDASRVDVQEMEAWASTLVVALGLASRVRGQ